MKSMILMGERLTLRSERRSRVNSGFSVLRRTYIAMVTYAERIKSRFSFSCSYCWRIIVLIREIRPGLTELITTVVWSLSLIATVRLSEVTGEHSVYVELVS